MDKAELIEKLMTKKNKDYTYIILFFLIFSFFVFFAIRPNLISVFSANSEIKTLTETDAIYEAQINKIIDIQSLLEATRNDLFVMDQAMPYSPEINKIVEDLEKLTAKNKLETEKIDIANIDLKNVQNNELKQIKIEAEVIGDFEEIHSFINDLESQRRLKEIKEIEIQTDTTEASKGSELKIKLQIESYYL